MLNSYCNFLKKNLYTTLFILNYMAKQRLSVYVLMFITILISLYSCNRNGSGRQFDVKSESEEVIRATPLFDSCVLQAYASIYGCKITIKADTSYVSADDSFDIKYVIPMDMDNLMINCVNSLFIEKTVPVILGTTKAIGPLFYFERWTYTVNLYHDNSEEELWLPMELYSYTGSQVDSIIYSPEIENLTHTIMDITEQYTDVRRIQEKQKLRLRNQHIPN